MIAARLPVLTLLVPAVLLGLSACNGDTSVGAEAGDRRDPAAVAAELSEPQPDVVAPQPDAEAATTTAVSAEEPLDPLNIEGEIVQDTNLVPGDCFNRIEDVREGRRVLITARVDCSQAHIYEVFHSFEINAPHPSIYPGDTAMHDYARKVCYEQFNAYVGEIYELSIYEIGVFTPDRVNFEDDVARYRGVRCWLYPEGEQPVHRSALGTAV